MLIAPCDFAQVVARTAIEAVNPAAIGTRGFQQTIERKPVVTPIEIVAQSLAKLGAIDLAGTPRVEDVLVASKDGFQSEHHGAISSQLGDDFLTKELGTWQGMVVANQHDIAGRELLAHLRRAQDRVVRLERLGELAQVFAATVRIGRADG